jgi:hypothetical protein
MKQGITWFGMNITSAPSGLPSQVLHFRWPGGRGLIHVVGFSQSGGVTIQPSVNISDLPGAGFQLSNDDAVPIAINTDGVFPFDAPPGELELQVIGLGEGDSVAWEKVCVFEV